MRRRIAALCTLWMGCGSAVTAADPASTMPAENANGASSQSEDVELLEGTHEVLLTTSLGDIELELDADAAPLAVTNFVTHAQRGYYDDLTFHRVIPGFMIQGGDPTGNGTGGTSIFGRAFEDEPNDIALERGVLAMANSGPNTNGSQFFIIQAEDGTPHLQGKHTAFGRVTSGIEVVDAITEVETDRNDRPLTPVTMTPKVQ